MIETLSPGVFIQEITSSTQVVQAVTTSNLGIVGWAPQGPIEQATFVGSFTQYTQIFGGPTHNSLMPLSMTAFFANGGTQAYVVRVPPTDSVAAQAAIQTKIFDQQIATGNGISNTPYDTSPASTPLLGIAPSTESPQGLVPGTLSIRWRSFGTLITGQAAVERTVIAPNITTPLTTLTGTANYEGRITPFATATIPSSLNTPPYAAPLILTSLLGGQTQYQATIAVSGASIVFTQAGNLYTFTVPSGTTVQQLVTFIDQTDEGDFPFSASCLSTSLTSGYTLPAATIAVASTAGFNPGGGTFQIAQGAGFQTITYTGIAGNTFTTCTGGTGTVSNGAYVSGGVGTLSATGPVSFIGLPTFNPDMDSIVPAAGGNAVVITWSASGVPVSLTIPEPTSFYPTSQATSPKDTAGSYASFDFRSGFFTLVTVGAEIPVSADNDVPITITYQPTTSTNTILGNGTVVNGVVTQDTLFTSSNGSINTGSTTIASGSNGETLPQGTINVASTTGFATQGTIVVTTSAGIQYVSYTGVSGGNQFTGCTGGSGTMTTGGLVTGSYLNDVTGAYMFQPVIGFTPHVNARVLATYYVNAWALTTELSGTLLQPSTGLWGNTVALQIQGDADSFAANPSLVSTVATVPYGYDEFKVLVLQYSTATLSYQVQETYDGIQFTTPTAPNYFPTVINDLSQLISVDVPGGSNATGTGPTLAPMTLDGNGLQQVIGGGGGTNAFNTTLQLVTANAVVAARSVIITYTNTSAAVQTIADDGNGNLTGAVSGPSNTINYSTGAIVFQTNSTIQPGTFVTATYAQAPLESSAPGQPGHIEYYGDAGGVGISVAKKGYQQGFDGTFTNPNLWGEEQFSAQGGSAEANYQGLYALSKVDELMQVAIPDFGGNALVSADQLAYAYGRTLLPSGGDRFIILSTPMGETAQGAVNWFRYSLAQYSDYAALYWPWIQVADPLNNGQPITIPPLGHVAGVYARTDANRNVGKAPGGTVDGQLNFLIGLEYSPTQQDRDLVYQNKINPLISSAQAGNAVWGVRTISLDTEWRYINARRLFMFLEKSIYNSTFWIVFENNGPQLWSKIKGQIVGFMQSLFSQGYFAGNSPEQAFFVTVDSTNNTPATIAAGQVIINVGAAPNTPAEFVIFQFSQVTLNS